MKRNILAIGAAASVAAVSFVGLAATPASAATTTAITPNSFISANTGLHNAPSTQAPAVKTVAAGTPVYAMCFNPKGEKIDGNENWFRIAVDEQTRGWVPRAAIGGVPALPQC
jgi:hypothetical protein